MARSRTYLPRTGPRAAGWRHGWWVAGAAAALAGCTHGLGALREPPRAYAVATGGPVASMIYAARVDGGVIVVDLGSPDAEPGLRRALARLGAAPGDVTDVFVTHSHRDHIAAWFPLRHARFHLAAPEAALFTGARRHGDLPSRLGDALLGGPGPWPGEVALRPFARDTALAFGADTVHAFPVPGHTAGSAAYLFRRTLFAGDAFAWSPLTGLRGASHLFSADRRGSAAAFARVLRRARELGVDRVCNAHGKCFAPDDAFLRRMGAASAGG